MLASGVAKDFCLRISWPNIVEEFTLARNPSSATCATNDSPIQGTSNYIFFQFIFNSFSFYFAFFSSLSHHRKRHAGVIHSTPRVITQQTITSANGEQAVIVTTGGDEDEGEVDSEDEAAAAAAALTGRATLGRATHLLADGGIVFEVQQE